MGLERKEEFILTSGSTEGEKVKCNRSRRRDRFSKFWGDEGQFREREPDASTAIVLLLREPGAGSYGRVDKVRNGAKEVGERP